MKMKRTGSAPSVTAQGTEAFKRDVLAGLRNRPRTLPCKYFYDERGSLLFDRICELPEYYPTRTETAILRRRASEIAAAIGPRASLIEFGSGSSTKTPILLEALDEPAAYIPIDISLEHLERAATRLSKRFPELEILPLGADYTKSLGLPTPRETPRRRVVWFPGSTIGNFRPQAALGFLARVRELCGHDGLFLIGVDLEKDPAVLERAYNDAAGITAAFNRNILHRIRRELGGDLDVDRFRHRAVWNDELHRIEMHLESKTSQTIWIDGELFEFAAGETIHTENSYKYSRDRLADLAHESGWSVEHVWTDEDRLFSVALLRSTE